MGAQAIWARDTLLFCGPLSVRNQLSKDGEHLPSVGGGCGDIPLGRGTDCVWAGTRERHKLLLAALQLHQCRSEIHIRDDTEQPLCVQMGRHSAWNEHEPGYLGVATMHLHYSSLAPRHV